MSLLPAILSGSQTPHQPFLLIQDSAAAPGIPLLAELVQRARDDDFPIVLVCALHPPAQYGLGLGGGDHVLDLPDVVPGYTAPSSSTRVQPQTIAEIAQWIAEAVHKAGRRAQVFIDALDIIATDYGCPSGARKLVKDTLALLSSRKAPARLTLLLPSSSPLFPHLAPSALSTTLTHLTLHPPALVRSVSTAYLLAPPRAGLPSAEWGGAEARWWGLLQGAGGADGDGGVWGMISRGEAGAGAGASADAEGAGLAVEVLVRRAQGGASKGMGRAIEGLVRDTKKAGSGRIPRLKAVRWDELPGLAGLATRLTGDLGAKADASGTSEATSSSTSTSPPASSSTPGSASGAAGAPAPTHPSQLHIPFNLSLTPAQAASRADVPVPYAHEGDEGMCGGGGAGGSGSTPGAGRILFEPGSEDDMDEDDPDEDLDF